jgi:nicotinamidase-related amidase
LTGGVLIGVRLPIVSLPLSAQAWVVIDAQRAFVDPSGSLARTYGVEEVRPGVAALGRLRERLAVGALAGPAVWVRSEYRPGQFTDGQLNHGLADLCVPGRNVDCEWAAGVDVPAHHVVVTKHQVDAWHSDVFRAAIEQVLQSGVGRIVVVGFQFTTCVAASAVSMLDAVGDRGVRVAVIEELTGSRASSYLLGASGLSRVELTRRRLRSVGVELVRDVERAV